MSDPHVVALTYRLVHGTQVEFKDPPPVEWETDAFRLRLEGGLARAEMIEHYASVQEARGRVQSFLRAWEMWGALTKGWPEAVQFEFEGAEVVDRRPPLPGAPREVSLEAGAYHVAGMSATLIVGRKAYPEPPQGFAISPDVETMWMRYEAYKEGREPLASMAYVCLTLLEVSAGGREKAASQYGISRKVLDTLARLSTEVGGERTIRKFTSHAPRPHTAAEEAWALAAIRAMIRRAGEWAANLGVPLPVITMADLPPL